MIDDCLMTEECPGYDRDRRVCLLRPGDCDIAPADRETDLVFEAPEGAAVDGSAEAAPR